MTPPTTTTDLAAALQGDNAPHRTADVIRVGGVPIANVVAAVRDAVVRVTLILAAAVILSAALSTWALWARLGDAIQYQRKAYEARVAEKETPR